MQEYCGRDSIIQLQKSFFILYGPLRNKRIKKEKKSSEVSMWSDYSLDNTGKM